ncbi:protein artemis-like [Periplaneta americana]|uniref:protein artemis-like n=1 Tax=Periplaneta americana TaxID=6978 RepID=UPI0037E71C14
MSCFEGRVKELGSVSIDCFQYSNLQSTVYFLSHCHSDHMGGLRSEAFLKRLGISNDIYLYCSEITRLILSAENTFSEVLHKIKDLPLGASNIVPIPDRDGFVDDVTVTLIPTGHCPGAVMFLFEGRVGRILYTGDFRLSKGDTPKFRQLHYLDGTVKTIDKLYLDTTFLSYQYKEFPSRIDSFDIMCYHITSWLDDSDDNHVYIQTPAKYGSEALFIAVAKRLGSKVHVKETAYDIYKNVAEIREAVTFDSFSTRIHCCEPLKPTYRKDGDKLWMPCIGKWCNVRFIRPCAMTFKSGIYNGSLESAVLKANGQELIRICYSCHCSLRELEDFIKYLKPKQIEACVLPPGMADTNIMQLLEEVSTWDNSSERPVLTIPSRNMKRVTHAENITFCSDVATKKVVVKTEISSDAMFVEDDIAQAEDDDDVISDSQKEICRLVAEDLMPKSGDSDADIRQSISATFLENVIQLKKSVPSSKQNDQHYQFIPGTGTMEYD